VQGQEAVAQSVFATISENAKIAEGTREISYEQFLELRFSGEAYVLLDVLMADTYAQGHIAGARNFPVTEITAERAKELLNTSDNLVVYCGSFACHASTKAAQQLEDLGYTVVDYKGGLAEWQEKGNALVSS